jgi:hypothetical protein
MNVDPLTLIFSPAHIFAGKLSVALMELVAEQFVMPEPSSRTRLLVERTYGSAG